MLPSTGSGGLVSLALAVAPLTRITSAGSLPRSGVAGGRSWADSDVALSRAATESNLLDIVVPPGRCRPPAVRRRRPAGWKERALYNDRRKLRMSCSCPEERLMKKL